jgi:PAS domain S-box-containing protein
MRAYRVAAALILVLLPALVAASAPKNVLIVRGPAPDLPSGRVLVDSIETTIRGAVTTPVEFFVEDFDSGRFGVEAYDDHLSALIADKYTDIPLDLVVVVGEPAVQFVLRERPAMFPRTPVLVGLVDRRLFDEHALPPNAAVVYVRLDAQETIRFAQRAYPGGRRVLVAGGTSRFDRSWQRAVREDLRGIESTTPVAYDVDSSLDDLTRRVSTLPPDTLVLYVSMTRDGTDSTVRPIESLERLRGAAAVPIFGLTSTYVGHGVVGGIVLDCQRHGADLGRQAARMLGGDVPPPTTTPPVPMADWRELQRFHIESSELPASTVVAFREPTLWEQERGTILTASAVVIAESALILALVRAGSRQRESQAELVARLRFERMVSEVSVAIASAPGSGTALAIEAALNRLAASLGIDRVWRWRLDDPRDAEWESLPLRIGEPATFSSRAALPPSVRERLGEGGAGGCSAFAVPLVTGGVTTGALFWVSRQAGLSWDAHADQLRLVGAVVATALQRNQAETALEGSNHLKSAILDSLPSHIAVLDREGVIIGANDAWFQFARENNVKSDESLAPGASYLRACQEAVRDGDAVAAEAVALIERACRGEWNDRTIEYRCDAPDCERWFLMRAEPLRRPEGGAVVTHVDITARKRDEIALRESEDRFRRLADGLPVAIWMADLDGSCTYCNREWIEMTGRSLQAHFGYGWLESVHLDDQTASLDAYLRAVQSGTSFRTEFRIRRHDGEFRWMATSGMPRYGSDGRLHGFVGGCIDITDRKNAEHILRDLSHRLMNAQDDERRRIARELHDHLSQQLALLAIDLQQLSMQQSTPAEMLIPALHEAWRRTTEIASDVHAISHRLHPSKMEALGLVATIRAHCREISRQSVVVDFIEQDVPSAIPPERALGLFRVLEEGLSNVVRHSGARSAQVALAGDGSELLLRIADDGRGFQPDARQGGLGLVSMRERTHSLDGTLSITSTPGRGTVIEARIPLTGTARPAADAAVSARAESA